MTDYWFREDADVDGNSHDKTSEVTSPVARKANANVKKAKTEEIDPSIHESPLDMGVTPRCLSTLPNAIDSNTEIETSTLRLISIIYASLRGPRLV